MWMQQIFPMLSKTKRGECAGPCMNASAEGSLKVLLQSEASLHGCAGGFVLLIEVNFLGYQFARHVGKIDGPCTSPQRWEMTLFLHRHTHFYHPKSNYKQGGRDRCNLAGGDLRKINYAGWAKTRWKRVKKIARRARDGNVSVCV